MKKRSGKREKGSVGLHFSPIKYYGPGRVAGNYAKWSVVPGYFAFTGLCFPSLHPGVPTLF